MSKRIASPSARSSSGASRSTSRAVALEHGLVALEVVDALGLEGDVLDAVAGRLGEDRPSGGRARPSPSGTRGSGRAPPPAARAPPCSTPRTGRGRGPAPRRGRVGRSPWAHRPSHAPASGSKVFQIVQRSPWRPKRGQRGWWRSAAWRGGGAPMAFDGEAFVQDLREELQASGRTLDRAVWIERVVQGEATPQELVGWARQHYWGDHVPHPPVPVGVGHPHAVRDDRRRHREHRRGGARHDVEVGQEPPPLAVRVHPRPRRARHGDHRCHPQRRRRGQRELPLQPRLPAARGTR